MPGPTGSRQSLDLARGQRGQERLRHRRIHPRSADVLAGGQAFVRAQVIADIFPAAFVTSVHFVAASCAPGNAVQQKIAVTGRSSRLEAHVFSSVVLDNAADFLVDGPVDVGWVPVPHDDPPVLDGKRHFPERAAVTGDAAGTGPAVDESPGISGASSKWDTTSLSLERYRGRRSGLGRLQ